MIDLNDIEEFQLTLQEAEKKGKPVIIDFYATWCGPCKSLAPKYEKLAMEFAKQVQFCRVNVDVAKDLTNHCEVKAMPTIQAFRSGKIIGFVEGANEIEIRSLVTKAMTP